MEGPTLQKIVREIFREEESNGPNRDSRRTKECPGLTRFRAISQGTWTDEERQHVARCEAYCQRMIETAWRVEPPNFLLLIRYASGRLPEIKGAMSRYLGENRFVSLKIQTLSLAFALQRIFSPVRIKVPGFRVALSGLALVLFFLLLVQPPNFLKSPHPALKYQSRPGGVDSRPIAASTPPLYTESSTPSETSIDSKNITPPSNEVKGSDSNSLVVRKSQKARLTIEGMPGERVWIDGLRAGTLNAHGRFTKDVTPGRHSIILREGEGEFEEKGIQLVLSLSPGTTALYRQDGTDRRDTLMMSRPLRALAKLTIEGGTSDAEVWIDGLQAGTLNEEGGFIQDGIKLGRHSIILRKAEFEEKAIQLVFSPGKTVSIAGADAQLIPFGAIVFHIVPDTATVFYSGEQENQPHEVTNGSSVHVRRGRYVISASAPDFQPRTETVTLASGTTFKVDWVLYPRVVLTSHIDKPVLRPPSFPPDNPSFPPDNGDWKDGWIGIRDGWLYHNGEGIGWWRGNEGLFRLVIMRPKAVDGFFRKKRSVRLTVDWEDPNNHVNYLLSGQSVQRKMFINGKVTSYSHAVHLETGNTWDMEFDMRRSRIVIKLDGKVLDEFERPDPTKPLGRFGFQGDIAVKSQQ